MRPIKTNSRDTCCSQNGLLAELEAREGAAEGVAAKKELMQGVVNLTHQVQALRTVIGLFEKDGE